MFKRLFGIKNVPKVSPHEAIVKVKETIEILDKKINFNEGKILKYQKEAIASKKNGNQIQAISRLKQSKRIEQSVSNLYKQRETLEVQIITLESSSMNQEIVKCIKYTTQVIKDNKMDIETIDNTMDNAQETLEDARLINDAMSQPVEGVVFDEDELAEELEMLMADDGATGVGEELVNNSVVLPVSEFPEVPSNPIPEVSGEDEEELRQLKALVG